MQGLLASTSAAALAALVCGPTLLASPPPPDPDPASLTAQDPLPPREHYIYHVYTDPLRGDNDLAWRLNPGMNPPTTNPLPLDRHPDPGDPPNNRPRPVGGLLQHAPYAFRTLTGDRGAIAYVNHLSNLQQLGGTGFLPWTNPNTKKQVKWVVIHCLPGLYGPFLNPSNPTDIDPRSGLPYNGEVWPARLPNQVSLQGTSALDTILDGRSDENLPSYIIEVTNNAGVAYQLDYEDAFIDSLTIRGARSAGGGLPTGAGIYVGGEGNIAITVSNCFITDNVVGIAINNLPIDASNEWEFVHRPFIINNTIAWNTVGIWSGSNPSPPGQNRGWACPVVLNNVFDVCSPYPAIPGVFPPQPPVDRTAFQGLHPEDLTVASRTVGTTTTPINATFNAWQDGWANDTSFWAANNWPPPTPRPGGATTLPTPVDITPWAPPPGFPTTARGSLYINDIFRNAAAAGWPGLAPDHSPHDFRLTPNVSVPGEIPSPPPLGRNPLVNMGLWLDPAWDTVTSTITMQATPTVTLPRSINRPNPGPPGIPLGADDYIKATYHCWDWDAEGFGNPRVVDRPGYPYPSPAPPEGPDLIDLGAHELKTLTMAGYIESTRIFSAHVPNAPGIAPHWKVYFFDQKSSPTGGGPYPRPQHNSWTGRDWRWWDHVQVVASGPGGPAMDRWTPPNQPISNYTAGTPGSWRWVEVFVRQRMPPFMRSLECDISPHLFIDPHPLWGEAFKVRYGGGEDIYATNPWYMTYLPSPPNPLFGDIDNPTLYYNPPPGYPVHFGFWINASFLPSWSVLLASLPTPPGTMEDPFSPTHLHPYQPVTQFGPFWPCANTSSTTYVVGEWGFGDVSAGCPDEVPFPTGTDWLGIRYNCEVGPGQSNLQTFLGIRGEPPVPPQPGGSTLSTGPLPGTATLEETGRAIREAMRALEKK